MTPLKFISERKTLRGDPKFPFGSLALASVRSAKECLPAVANIWSVWSYNRAAVRSKKTRANLLAALPHLHRAENMCVAKTCCTLLQKVLQSYSVWCACVCVCLRLQKT